MADMTDSGVRSELEVNAYLADLRYALGSDAQLTFQSERMVDRNREQKYTNKYTVAALFPNEDPREALRRELASLNASNYLRTVQDRRFPKRSAMWEFGKVYNDEDEVYIKIRVELLTREGLGNHATFVMSFHFAQRPFSEEVFPYRRGC